LGKRLSIEGGEFMTVCGVVRDVVQRDWMAPRSPEVYLPLAQHPEAIGRGFNSSMTVVTRAAVDIRSLVASVNNAVPVSAMETMDEVVSNATQRSRVYAALLGVFASSALLLALIGLYGLVSSDVSRRTQEIGVRAALGARPLDISKMVLRDAMSLAAIGTVLGVACSLAASRALESMLYGVKPADAPTMVGAVVLFACVAGIAAALPARRAAKLDPLSALRSE
jgi:putative ABC transport system permease protein